MQNKIQIEEKRFNHLLKVQNKLEENAKQDVLNVGKYQKKVEVKEAKAFK